MEQLGESVAVEKEFMEWMQFGEYTEELATRIRNYERVKELTRVVGISRGGLPLGVALSHKLDLPFTPVCIRSYNNGTQGELLCDTPLEVLQKCTGHILLVDDLADSGKTSDFLMSKISELTNADFTIATLYYKETSAIKPHFFIEQTDRWIVFPWESV